MWENQKSGLISTVLKFVMESEESIEPVVDGLVRVVGCEMLEIVVLEQNKCIPNFFVEPEKAFWNDIFGQVEFSDARRLGRVGFFVEAFDEHVDRFLARVVVARCLLVEVNQQGLQVGHHFFNVVVGQLDHVRFCDI